MKTTTYKASEEFVVGRHDIGWISSDFLKYFGDQEFEVKAMPTFQRLPLNMTDAEIENEFKPGICELGDILAFLKNPIEECKNGKWNIFYTSSCVVGVDWIAGSRGWSVITWQRSDRRWGAGGQVFSPAIDTKTLRPSDPLDLEKAIEQVKKAGYQVSKII